MPKPLQDVRFRTAEQFMIQAHLCINGYSLKKRWTGNMLLHCSSTYIHAGNNEHDLLRSPCKVGL
ncbi:hypothetical protein CJF42_18615 [Pseudoalteromonas sp. NBT06-2]|nr:hypothetical protein CJF42_18615 [Pseudoalteromonas sp. NBT06-2]